MTVQPSRDALLEIRQVTKNFGGLRPLRLVSLTIVHGERVSIGGIDAGVGELIVNLVTGASLADEGEIRVFGRLTADIATSDDWLDSLEQFGIVSPRGVLLEGSTLQQNLAMPFTLAIDPVPPAVETQVAELAKECGIDPDRYLAIRAGDLRPEIRVRAHLARALALNPRFVVIEHPTAEVPQAERLPLAVDMARACSQRQVTTLVLTNDEDFAKIVAPRNLMLHGATGELKPIRKGWFAP